jgi:hypothetical protein
MNVEIGTEAAQFPEKEYINEIFVAVVYLTNWCVKKWITLGLINCIFSMFTMSMKTQVSDTVKLGIKEQCIEIFIFIFFINQLHRPTGNRKVLQ